MSREASPLVMTCALGADRVLQVAFRLETSQSRARLAMGRKIEATSLFVLPLERLGVRYMVTGAVVAVISDSQQHSDH
ncbi:MAG: hypothetical protein KatS3mg081_2910 [Gemmatimonadales bacterium]|nr:MAG: hypothetical protein KatS3mg081_2910 [Gemmatimonadales bacterium]